MTSESYDGSFMEDADADGPLFDQPTLRARVESGSIEGWKADRYRAFRETMTSEADPYPCTFAVEAEEEGLFRYLFASTDERGHETVARGLEAYLDGYEDIGRFSSLAMFFEPPAEEWGPGRYKRAFWDVLRYLNRNDPSPWPPEVPTDPEHPKWEFCFAGEPLFLVVRAPFYDERRSRHAEYGLEITVQPKSLLSDLSGLTDEGQRIRSVIRSRLADYDDVPMHPDSGDFEDPRTTEWKQYMLPETNAESVARVPLEPQDDVRTGPSEEGGEEREASRGPTSGSTSRTERRD